MTSFVFCICHAVDFDFVDYLFSYLVSFPVLSSENIGLPHNVSLCSDQFVQGAHNQINAFAISVIEREKRENCSIDHLKKKSIMKSD